MHAGIHVERRKQLIASILLLAFASHMLVPMGFMPATDHTISLQICPEGFPVQLLHIGLDHGHGAHGSGSGSHHHDSSRSEHCVFAAVSGAPPVTHTLVVLGTLANLLTPLFNIARPMYRAQWFRIQQPRGPPFPI
ncbi:MAG TPA: DUF2946 family protein [Steroidobacteraceae bacterium]|jgi:hypothetical protein|nr:DUF2946 family protein [Steroidobacteraceae bacterium]